MWHWHKNPLNISADIISCVEFNSTGDLLATGDKGGRVVIFQRDKAVRLNIDTDVYFKLHVCICNWGSSMLSILASYFLKVYLAPWAKGSKELFWLKVQLISSDGNLTVVVVKFHILVFFSKSTGPISSKLVTKYPWMNEIQICSNKGPVPWSFSGRVMNEIVKIQ